MVFLAIQPKYIAAHRMELKLGTHTVKYITASLSDIQIFYIKYLTMYKENIHAGAIRTLLYAIVPYIRTNHTMIYTCTSIGKCSSMTNITSKATMKRNSLNFDLYQKQIIPSTSCERCDFKSFNLYFFACPLYSFERLSYLPANLDMVTR